MTAIPHEQENRDDINLTPMLDVVFILLIYFIVSASFIKDFGVPVGLPSGLGPPPADVETITVMVEPGHTFVVNGRARSGGSLVPYIQRMRAEYPDAGFAVLVTKDSVVADTVRAIDAGRRTGFGVVPVSEMP